MLQHQDSKGPKCAGIVAGKAEKRKSDHHLTSQCGFPVRLHTADCAQCVLSFHFSNSKRYTEVLCESGANLNKNDCKDKQNYTWL